MPLNTELTLFSSVLFFIGILLLVLSINAQTSLKLTCVSKNVQIGFNIIISVAVMLIVFPIAQLICFGQCTCTGGDLKYKLIVSVLLLIIGISGAVIWNGINANPECESDKAKNTALAITLISFLSMPLVIFRKKIITYFRGDSDKMPGMDLDSNL